MHPIISELQNAMKTVDATGKVGRDCLDSAYRFDPIEWRDAHKRIASERNGSARNWAFAALGDSPSVFNGQAIETRMALVNYIGA